MVLAVTPVRPSQKESSASYTAGNRQDLADKESSEADFISTFLPKAHTTEEVSPNSSSRPPATLRLVVVRSSRRAHWLMLHPYLIPVSPDH